MEGKKGCCCCRLGRLQGRRREGIFGVGNEKKKRVLPNKNFLFIFPLFILPFS